jgi:hypothetical protein
MIDFARNSRGCFCSAFNIANTPLRHRLIANPFGRSRGFDRLSTQFGIHIARACNVGSPHNSAISQSRTVGIIHKSKQNRTIFPRRILFFSMAIANLCESIEPSICHELYVSEKIDEANQTDAFPMQLCVITIIFRGLYLSCRLSDPAQFHP